MVCFWFALVRWVEDFSVVEGTKECSVFVINALTEFQYGPSTWIHYNPDRKQAYLHMQLACAFWGSNFEILEHGTGWMVENSEEGRKKEKMEEKVRRKRTEE